ncbi:MAG: hypothetical protein P4L92_19905 [Rudaea sp.]|nr:hypothetical protein [Rudaea sp.]
MVQKFIIGVACGFYLFTSAMPARAALTVTQPTAATVVAAGDDYATQVLGNAWDMNDAVDIDTEESQYVSPQAFASGVFSGTTTANGANIYPLFMGYASSVNLSRGANFPIDTSHYRYVTYKLRVNQASQPQFTRVVGIVDGGSYGATPKATVVESLFTAQLPNNVWTIVSFDMVTNNDNQFYHWTDFPQLTGLRIDPATTNAAGAYAGVQFNIDWIRLTAPATAAQKTNVQWTDSGSATTYTVSAIDAGSVSYVLGSGLSGTSYLADTSFLSPGQYTIKVTRNSDSVSASSGTFRINNPAAIAMTAPSVRGEQSLNFAQTIVGNPWGPITASDFVPGIGVRNFTNVSYTNPAGSFYGRPINGDPGWFFNLGGQTINTSLYRSLCFTLEVFGQRSVGGGSVARLFWGPSTGVLTTSLPIPLDTGLSEYCIADVAAYAPDPAAPASGGTWSSAAQAALRMDPDELTPANGCGTPQTCFDVQLNSLILSPFAHANPNYTFAWTLNDTDNSSVTLSLALDADTTPGNGNEFQIYSQLVSNGAGTFAWPGTATIPSGTYHVLATVDDGVNVVNQYAGGVIIVTSDDIFRNGFETP